MRRRTFLAQCAALVAPRPAIAGRLSAPLEVVACHRALRFLIDRQHEDGSWKSDVYGAFKDGRALTPLVSLALTRVGSEISRGAVAEAMPWIEAHTAGIAGMFPIHNASWILQATAGGEDYATLRQAMTGRLRQLQLNASLGWERRHPYFGGWSYAPLAPRAANETAPFQQPNLSASVLAIAGLIASGTGADAPIMRDALRFLRRCQNLPRGGRAPSRFDDGGFFQLHDDPSRNKAGLAGTDSDGRVYQRSYTSATADGLRGLTMCGLDQEDPGVAAATRWLDKNLRLDDVPDLRHYAAYSTALAGANLPTHAGARTWRKLVKISLLKDQRADGSWQNTAGEMRENDPLVATSLAVLALA